MFRRVKEDIEAIFNQDPAARSRLEVALCYPGFHAVTIHQFSHMLWEHEFYTLARFISQVSRVVTGIEIHPGATLGRRVFIDHGMGVVIGETTIIGDDCTIYQGVTLGAGSAARMGSATRGTKRHPTLGTGVVVGSGAEIQGDIMVGDNTRIASGSILLKDVPHNSVVVGVPGRVVYRDGIKVKDQVPDIEAEAIKALKERIQKLEKQLHSVTACIESLQPSTPLAPVNEEEATPTPASSTDPVDVFLHGAGI
ncbi:MAG TPA: serine O-acetyltransferase [Drouetiella sp.]